MPSCSERNVPKELWEFAKKIIGLSVQSLLPLKQISCLCTCGRNWSGFGLTGGQGARIRGKEMPPSLIKNKKIQKNTRTLQSYRGKEAFPEGKGAQTTTPLCFSDFPRPRASGWFTAATCTPSPVSYVNTSFIVPRSRESTLPTCSKVAKSPTTKGQPRIHAGGRLI